MEEQLRQAGRSDLAAALRRSAERLDDVHRSALGGGRGVDNSPGITVHGRSYRAGVLSQAQRAWSDFDDARRRAAEFLGPTTRDNTTAALRHLGAPLVVVGAAAEGGFVVVASADRTARCRVLQGLTAREVEARARALLDAGGRPTERLVRTLLAWCRDAVTAHVEDLLQDGDDGVVVVPVGALGVLPLHAAFREEGGGAGMAVRYAPNIGLGVAAATTAARPERRGDALVIASTTTPGFADLPATAVEAEAVARRLETVVTVEPTEQLLREHPGSVWHLACHATVDALHTLDGELHLGRTGLAVREILASVPRARRLAVLSACSTSVSDSTRLDEVIGFPGALVQAGFAGVVAPSWQVADDAALYLMLAFHDRWAIGQEPARALADAQAWLRGATRDDLAEAFPTEYRVPTPYGPEHMDDPAFRSQRPYAAAIHWAPFALTGA